MIRKRVDILVFTASIDEYELAVAHDLVVPRVVDSEGVFTGKVIQLYAHVTMTGWETYPDATTGTYACRCEPARAQRYS